MLSRVMAKWGWGRSAKAERRLREAVCQPLEERLLLAKTIYVDVNSPAPAVNGPTWNTAYTDLQLALSAAVAGDTIKVADGTYKPTATTTRSVAFQLKTGVGIYGGYAGYGAADPNARNMTAYPTVLSGDIGAVGTNTDNSYHVVVGSGTNGTAVLDGCTITAGNANGTSSPSYYGGGMCNSGGSPTLSNCIFSGNSASSSGGGMYNASSASPTLSNCTFSGNSTTDYGGGMFNASSSPTLINCTFSVNSATGFGGGMYNTSANPTLANCTFSGNSASTSGGGMFNSSSSSPKLINCTLLGNSAAYGGGMYNSSSGPTLANCIVWGNGPRSPQIYQSGGTTAATYCDIQGGFEGIGNVNVNPQFMCSPWPGPDGVFGTADDDRGDLRLRAGSPALDAGANAAAAGITTDAAGNARIQNGTVDLGAYEGAVSVAAAKTIYVDTNAIGTNVGTSWSNACNDLQSAVLVATDGDTIRIADGTYKPATTTDRTLSFQLRSNVAVYVGYAGYGAPNPDGRDVVAFPTILSGDIGAGGNNMDNSYHVVTAIVAGGSFIVDGIVMTLGNANGSGSSQQAGGGLYAVCLSLTLTNCTFISDSALSNGGGLCDGASSSTLTNCRFISNTASSSGGGLYAQSTTMVISGVFIDNHAQEGGGMYTSGSPTLFNCSFVKNATSSRGGGMYGLTLSASLTNCVFAGNSASEGGGICIANTNATTFTNCSFVGNSTINGFGGAMENISSSPTLTNCTFSSNTPGQGGVIYNNGGCSPVLTNCILWGNGYSPIYANGSNTTVITYSNVQGGYPGTGNISADPQFVRSPWAGPDRVFGTPDDDYGDLRLRAGSPALDAGSNAAVTGITTDAAGNARIQNGKVDLGAYEGPSSLPAPRTLYVDIDAAGNNTGVSWADAFTSVQSALLVAVDGDAIRIADGTYKPTATTDRTISFALKNGVVIFGGFAGYGAPDPNARDVAAYRSILSGDIGTVGSNTDNSYHVVWGSEIDSRTILDGVTITAGDSGGTESGGGLYNYDSNLTVNNCTLSGNSGYSGGGMANSRSSPKLTNCILTQNLATNSYGTGNNFGGGMANYSSSPTLINCMFIGNSAPSGGGMSNSGSSPTLTGCTFIGNSVAGSYGYGGGGMWNDSSNPTLANCTFIDNCASTASSGSGILNSGSNPKLTNCIVWGGSSAPILGGTPMITYSDVQGGYVGTGNINADPKFVRSPWTGPDGLFGTTDDDYDLRLRAGSPALDIGSNAAVTGVTTDSAGNPRIQNGTVDLGAYEGPVAVAAPRTIYVDVNAPGINSGISWSDAFASLQSALMAATDGDTIRIAHGTYTPTDTADRALGFALRNAVAIYGGYAGCGAPDPNSRNIVTYRTSLSGDIGAVGVVADNSYHVLTASEVGPSTVLDGVVVTAGNASGPSSSGLSGGGLFATGGSPTLINCIFAGNSAGNGVDFAGQGGGIYNTGVSTPALTNCVLIGNTAKSSRNMDGYGGGMYNSLSSNATLTNCTFSGNLAAVGGGLYDWRSNPILTNCIVWGSGNSPIYDAYLGAPVVTNSDIQGGYTGAGNINADPQFVRSPWTGPDGVFGTADDQGDLRLRLGSPALDIGSNTAVTGVTTDAAGNARIQNGKVDLGAYEGPVSPPAPKTCYADINAAGANTGVSWADAFTDVQSALLAAVDGDTIRIADGTYKPTATTDRTISFVLKNGVGIFGGYAGCGAADPNSRDIAGNRTILSGDIGIAGDNTDNSYHVVTAILVAGSSSILDGVSVTGGNANGSGTNQNGGGIYNSASGPALTNCTLIGNSAYAGGGMYNSSCSPKLTNCAFAGNSASSDGGGMYNYSSSPTLTNCTFTGNSATAWWGASGGGVYSYSSSSPTLTNCILWGNPARTDLQIYQSDGTLTVTHCDLQQTSGVYAGTGNINADPRFVRNSNAGADGKWGTVDDDYGDLRLLSASPGINVGSNAAVPVGVATDLAGNPRIVGVAVDMGAYEYSPSMLTFVGAAGSDTLYSRLSADQTQLQVWSGTGTDGTLLGSYPVAGSPGLVFDVGGGNNSLVLDVCNGVPAVPVNFVGGSGTDTLTITGVALASTVNAQGGKVVVNAATIYTPGVEAVVLDAAAGSAISLASLTVSTPVSLVGGKGVVLRTGSLNITGAGMLDLNGNSMILDYTSSPIAQVRGWMANGRMGVTPALKTSGSVFSGTGALGMVDNALVHLGSFAGQVLGGAFSQLLIESTVSGDTNLDGKVDQSDYLNVIANMGHTNAQWFLGDLNHDGVVTTDDVAEVMANLGAGAAFAAGPGLADGAAAAETGPAKGAGKPVTKKAAVKRPAAKGKGSKKVQEFNGSRV